jgi:hypothetical protein
MKKFAILGVLPLLASLPISPAAAQTTYSLTSAACGSNTYGGCMVYQVATTAFYLNWNTNGTVSVTQYSVSGNSLAAVANYGAVLPYNPLNGITDAILTNSDGSGTDVVVNGTFSVRHTCVRSGRGQHCTNYVSFLGGTLAQ